MGFKEFKPSIKSFSTASNGLIERNKRNLRNVEQSEH